MSLEQSLRLSLAPNRASQERPKCAPRAAESTPRAPPDQPRARPETPKSAQEHPKGGKSDPKAPQERPKSAKLAILGAKLAVLGAKLAVLGRKLGVLLVKSAGSAMLLVRSGRGTLFEVLAKRFLSELWSTRKSSEVRFVLLFAVFFDVGRLVH